MATSIGTQFTGGWSLSHLLTSSSVMGFSWPFVMAGASLSPLPAGGASAAKTGLPATMTSVSKKIAARNPVTRVWFRACEYSDRSLICPLLCLIGPPLLLTGSTYILLLYRESQRPEYLSQIGHNANFVACRVFRRGSCAGISEEVA
jgi:hypothetical protein